MNEVKMLNIGGSDQNIKDQYARNIIAPSENNLTAQDQPYASRDYDEGDYLIGQDRNLYKALTDIQTGDILAVNVNVKATTISDELVALENSSVEEALEIIAYTENSSLSTREYAIGDNLYWNYGSSQGLYKASASIAIGDAFAVGSNIEAAEPIAKQLEKVEDVVDTIVNDLGAKNLLRCTASSVSSNGITFTVYSDGSVNAVGTVNTANAQLVYVPTAENLYLEPGKYILNGCPVGGGATKYFIRLWNLNSSASVLVEDYGESVEFTLTVRTHVSCAIVVYYDSSDPLTINELFKPMIRPASIEDDTYVPYAKTNQKLTGSSIAQDNILGAKNFINVTATTQLLNGITYTVQNDGTIIANGTCDPNNDSLFPINRDSNVPKGFYEKSGCPAGGDSATYFLGGTGGNETGNGNRMYHDGNSDIQFIIAIRHGQTVNNLLFKPMLRPLGTDPTYAPYAMTNRELTNRWTWNYTNSEQLAEYTLTDTTEHNYTITATHDGLLCINAISSTSALELSCRMRFAANYMVGFRTYAKLGAYGTDAILTMPVKKGNVVAVSYWKITGVNTAKVKVINCY